ncbi:MAG: hypothetical protein AM1032_000300 [Mycoplasmataceae bacterium]|nr:MAG: hypothetical protein AM1032_000300 [Mycoplasmataceae bacterium]
MNNKNKKKVDFTKHIDKKQLDQLAKHFNLNNEELLMIEKINRNPLEIMNDKSSLEMISKTANKIFKEISEEDKEKFESFKNENFDFVNNLNNNVANSIDLNEEKINSEKENKKPWWKLW